jgi:hypothetical protein
MAQNLKRLRLALPTTTDTGFGWLDRSMTIEGGVQFYTANFQTGAGTKKKIHGGTSDGDGYPKEGTFPLPFKKNAPTVLACPSRLPWYLCTFYYATLSLSPPTFITVISLYIHGSELPMLFLVFLCACHWRALSAFVSPTHASNEFF